MEIINQLAAPLAQSATVARQQAHIKAEQVRRAQARQKVVAANGDTFEHAVESAEEVKPIHDEQKQQGQERQPRRPANRPTVQRDGTGSDDVPHIDVTG